MLYMVVEKFKNPDGKAIYQRFAERGRMLPDGLLYIQSWVETDRGRCFQLMECDDPKLLEEWTSRWSDLVDFEFARVVSSQEAARALGT